MANMVKIPFRYIDDMGDEGQRGWRLRMNKRRVDMLLRDRKLQRNLIKGLEHLGYLEKQGCDCGHCRAGWDCCARMVPSYVQIRRVKRGAVVIQHYSRNV